MKSSKMFLLFLLGTVFLIRTAGKKMFLTRTDHVKYIEKQYCLLNRLFLRLNFKTSFRVRIEKCSLTDEVERAFLIVHCILSTFLFNNWFENAILIRVFEYNFHLMNRNIACSGETNRKKHDFHRFLFLGWKTIFMTILV